MVAQPVQTWNPLSGAGSLVAQPVQTWNPLSGAGSLVAQPVQTWNPLSGAGSLVGPSAIFSPYYASVTLDHHRSTNNGRPNQGKRVKITP